MPNGTHITSSHTCELHLPTLPKAAILAHIFPALTSGPLLSIGQLCDHGCIAIFDRNTVQITFNNATVLQGHRNHNTGLWYVDVQSPSIMPPLHQACSVYHTTTLPELIQFLHATCFSPSQSTFIAAIQAGYLLTWPGLTAGLVAKYLPKSLATAKGHLDQQRKHIRSTAIKHASTIIDDTDFTLPTEVPSITHLAFANIIDATQETGKMYSDITGRFPVQSSRGHKYIFVLYDYDSNAILVEPLKSRAAAEILRAFQVLYARLRQAGRQPQLYFLDNEASALLKSHLHDVQVHYQLVPPHIHRRNAAERAIRTFKNHFVAGLASTDTKFPLHLWDRLLPQAELTLNLLRPARVNPKLSAYALLHGNFNFDATPLAPPGTRVLIHEKPEVRTSWAPHGTDGWYLGPASEHYRCYRVYATATASERISDTVEFFPEHTKLPYCSSADAAVLAAKQLIAALKYPVAAAPIAPIGTHQLAALEQLANIFNTAIATKDPAAATKIILPTILPEDTGAVRKAALPVRAPGVPAVRPVFHDPYHSAQTLPVPMSDAPKRYTLRQRPLHKQSAANHVLTLDAQPLLLPDTYHPLPHLANSVIDPESGRSLEYRDLIRSAKTKEVWSRSFANELGRLAQGVGGRVEGTNTCFFIAHTAVPTHKTATYARIVVELRPQKQEVERTRLTVGGDRIDYPGDVSTETADITTAKLLCNSVVSTPKAKFMVADIHNFYLNTPMPHYEYMRLHISLIPEEIIQQYNLLPLVHNGYVYIEIRKGMYGLPQAGILANHLLRDRLAVYGYYPCQHTPGLWKHKWRPILFTLVVDDFGIQYTGMEHAMHLVKALQEHYTISLDWTGALYCGITMKWDYVARTVDLSMPGYVRATLHKFQHPTPERQTDAPHKYNPPTFGPTSQAPFPIDESEKLPQDELTRIQQVVGTLLFYARAVDSTMRVALGAISSAQTKGTAATAEAVTYLLNYCASHPEATVRFAASAMILNVHSDASYLTEAEARSRAGGHYFMSDTAATAPKQHNGAVHTICGILKHVMASAAEAELGALFVNGKEATILRQTLLDMGWPQPPTPIQTDNSTACGIVNRTVKQQKSRAMDMRFYWIRDRSDQNHFYIFWAPGSLNLGDYFTKHHAPSHHRRVRCYYLHTTHSPRFLPQHEPSLELRGCVDPAGVHASTEPLFKQSAQAQPKQRYVRNGFSNRTAVNRVTSSWMASEPLKAQ
jgi:hypothetical protein